MLKKKPSRNDVAVQAGVSTATVSYVFNGRKNAAVPDATRQRVLEAAEIIGYRPNRLAQSLAHGKSHLVGLVTRLDTFDGRIAAPIREELTQRGYQILLARSRKHFELEQGEIELLLDHQVDALICVSGGWGIGEDRPLIRCVVEAGIPAVIVNDTDVSGQIDSVVSDNRGGVKMIVAHLVERGHTRIGHVPGVGCVFTAQERVKGFQEGLAAAGLPFDPELLQGGGYDKEAGYEGARRLLALDRPPTAIFAANDGSGAGVYHACMDLGLRVPQDVAIAGFGDEREADALRMTTVDQHPDEMAHVAVDRVFERMERVDMPVGRIVVPVDLLARHTT
ncbi:MAG TPA: LacI family DNA-binding transcriptional regulator [Capsulimonadaceae bacterium]|jgi:LacI family transcriptional regulator